MDKAQMLIKNGSYYEGDTLKRGDIAVADGKIREIAPPNTLPPDAFGTVVPADELTVLPGMIDPHTHLREPGREDREDIRTGTAAAAAGGITTVFAMPNVSPPVASGAALKACISLAEQKALVNVGFYAGAGFDNIADQSELAMAGAVAFKTFYQPLTKGREAEFAGIIATDPLHVEAILRAGAETGRRFFFHCEDFAIIKEREKSLHEAHEDGYDFHYRSRPDIAELSAVKIVAEAAKRTGTKVGICHISTALAAEAVKKARQDGVDMAAEVCFCHLLFDESKIDQMGPYAKMNPPLRTRRNVDALWECVKDGTIDYIGSDHAPLTEAEKESGVEHIWKAFSGLPSIEAMLPLLLNEAYKGRLTLLALSRLLSENAARVFGLYPGKGAVLPGSDADFTIVDPDKPFCLSVSDMYTKNAAVNRMFEGLCGRGLPVYTIVGGDIIMRENTVFMDRKGAPLLIV